MSNKIDPVLFLLTSLVLIFAGALIVVSKISPNDGQTFQILSNLVTGFSGALLMRINPKKPDDIPHTTMQGTFKQETPDPKEK